MKIAVESGIHGTVGIDLVAMCVNDLVVQGAEPLFFLDYFATGKLDPGNRRGNRQGHRRRLPRGRRALIGGETAEMPGVYAGGDYDLAGFAVGAAERGDLLPREDIAAGDVVFGLPASGVHSNGFSLVRKIVERAGLNWSDPAPFAPGQTPRRGAAGADPHLCEAAAGGLAENPGDQGLRPYHRRRLSGKHSARAARRPRRPYRSRRHSGPAGVQLAGRKRAASRSAKCCATFNCGIGMIVVADSARAAEAEEALRDSGEEPVRLGHVVAASGERVTFDGKLAL